MPRALLSRIPMTFIRIPVSKEAGHWSSLTQCSVVGGDSMSLTVPPSVARADLKRFQVL